MNAQTLINELQAAGFQIAVSGGRLRVSPFSRLTPELRAAMKSHRSEIIRALRRCPFCRQRDSRRERTVREWLVYFDTLCDACGEIIETYVPPLPVRARFEPPHESSILLGGGREQAVGLKT